MPSEALTSLYRSIVSSAQDWSHSGQSSAWIYGIVCGWDDASIKEFVIKYRWDEETIATLKKYHEEYKALERGE